MDKREVYQWLGNIRQHLELNKRQGETLAGLSLGVIATRRCTLSVVAEAMDSFGKADSVERRLDRWLANQRLKMAELQTEWTRWVMSKQAISEDGITLIVDETKLGEHLSTMMVGLAYERRCIGLAWACYAPHAWPSGQVKLITRLLKRVKAGLPKRTRVVVQADRGIGTSPDLVRAVRRLGWHYLFRVQGITHFQSPGQADTELRSLIQRGAAPYCASGQVFKDDGWLDTNIRLMWAAAYDEPWCLITDVPQLNGSEYGQRAWCEHSFRDLKSGGWHWHYSQVWRPDHAERLLLALILAYAATLSLGLRTQSQPELRARITRGKRRRFSWFRLGLRLLADFHRIHETVLFFLDFQPPLTSFFPPG